MKDFKEIYSDFEIIQNYLESKINAYSELKEINKINSLNEKYEVTSSAITKDDKLKQASLKLKKLTQEALALQEILAHRAHSIYETIQYALNKNNLLLLADSGRALFELMSLMAYLSYEAAESSETLLKSENEILVVEALEVLIGHFNNIFFTSTATYGEKSKNHEINKLNPMFNLESYISKYVSEEQFNVLNNDYNFLSELIHPNFGSNLTVSNGCMIPSSSIIVTNEMREEFVRKIFTAIHRMIVLTKDIEMNYIKSAIIIMDIYEISLRNYKSLDEIFLISGNKPEDVAYLLGDGHSKKTAFHFPNARTHNESVRLMIDLANQKRLTNRVFKGIENGWLYENYTRKGKIFWAKTLILNSL